jgi:zinc/manganese transport system ATP-binding protein
MILQHFPQTLLLARSRIAFGPSAQVLSAENRLIARRTIEFASGQNAA